MLERYMSRSSRVYPFYLFRPTDPFQKIYFQNRIKLISTLSPKGKPAKAYTPYLKSKTSLIMHWCVRDIFYNGLSMLKANHERVKKITGKNIVIQFLEMMYFSVNLPSMPENYYKFEWYLDSNKKNAKNYFHRYELKNVLYRMLLTDSEKSMTKDISKKDMFAKNFKEYNLPTPATICIINKNSKVSEILNKLSKIEDEVYIKPTNGKGGNGIVRYILKKENNHLMMQSKFDQKALLATQVIQEIIGKCSKSNLRFLVQPRVIPHDDIKKFSGKAAPTVRIVTAENEEGRAEALVAVFRMPSQFSSDVDNFHAGGIAAPVDLLDGSLGFATDMGLDKNTRGWLAQHPVNGAQIEGTVLPMWKELKKVACHAHNCFLPLKFIGWDICITNEGPVILEANLQCDTDLLQRPHRMGLKNQRFGELLLYHLNKRMLEGRP